MSTYKGRALGTIGHFGTISFHETKNYQCGEGGALLINDKNACKRAEIIQEKGTNRSQFIRGEVDKYTWRDVGSSYLLSEMNAAFLSVQLDNAEGIYEERMKAWNWYKTGLQQLETQRFITLPEIPNDCRHNAHMFYIKVQNLAERSKLMEYLKQNNIMAVSHYVPLHTSQAGLKYGAFVGEDLYTTPESEKLIRLPLYYGIEKEEVNHVVNHIQKFYQQ